MRNWKRTNERGTTAVEFALALPIFVAMFAAMLDFGGYFWAKNVATQAAREGARLAVLDDASQDEVISYVKDLLREGGVVEPPVVTVSETDEGKRMEVVIWVNYNFIMLDDVMSMVSSPTAGDEQNPDPGMTGILQVYASAFETKSM